MEIMRLQPWLKGVYSLKLGKYNKPRNIAIYFIGCLRGDRLKDVENFFGIAKNHTVSSVVRRLKRERIREKKHILILRVELIKGQE